MRDMGFCRQHGTQAEIQVEATDHQDEEEDVESIEEIPIKEDSATTCIQELEDVVNYLMLQSGAVSLEEMNQALEHARSVQSLLGRLRACYLKEQSINAFLHAA